MAKPEGYQDNPELDALNIEFARKLVELHPGTPGFVAVGYIDNGEVKSAVLGNLTPEGIRELLIHTATRISDEYADVHEKVIGNV